MKKKKSKKMEILKFVEKVGNKLPHPFLLFGIFIIVTLFVSSILSKIGFSATYLDEGRKAGDVAKMVTVNIVNLLTFDNLRQVVISIPETYVSFPALKITIIMMMAIGLIESTGFFHTIIRKYLVNAPKGIITAALIFVGINANIMSDAGTILTFTIGGLLFASIGRNPKLGIILGFAACSGGFTANMFISSTDALLAGITEQAVKSIGMDIPINPLCNYYFMAASTIFLTITLTFVTEKFMVKAIGNDYVSEDSGASLDKYKLTLEEHKGLRYALYGFLFFAVIMCILCIPKNGFFRNPQGGFLPQSPLISSIVPLTFFLFCAIGIGYGVGAGVIVKPRDFVKFLQIGASKAVPLLVTIFSASIFLDLLNRSNIFRILAIKGSFILKEANVNTLTLLLLVILITALINPFITSGSTKWILLAPMVVPMLALLDISPAFAQLAFRIGDSATNIISPVRSDIPVILGLMAQYDMESVKRGGKQASESGYGTIFSMTLPYSITILFTMTALMIVWYILGLPIGPGATLFIK